MLTDEQRRRAFTIIILNQCLGMLSGSLFQNGFYLNYFTKLGVSSSTIAFLFALPSLLSMFLLVPFAFYSDRFGKKKLALGGQLLFVVSIALMLVAGWWNPRWAIGFIVAALLVQCVGGSLQGASWFALLNPIIPKEIRGRFFGRLRVIFQSVSIVFALVITRMLAGKPSMNIFQLILGFVWLAAVLRYFTYSRIPEVENVSGESEHHHQPLVQALRSVLRVPGYVAFNGYIFFITFFTAAIPTIFGLMQKDVFGFTPAQITLIGTLFLVGSMMGCWLGGRVVDHHGSRFIFRFTHAAHILIMLLMLMRHWVPWSLLVHAGICAWAYSLVAGVAGVASTAKVLALIPSVNKSLSTAFTMSLLCAAIAFAGVAVSRSIQWAGSTFSWNMFGQNYTTYDTLLLTFATLTVLLFITVFGIYPRIKRSKC